jgi:hypothetical protein
MHRNNRSSTRVLTFILFWISILPFSAIAAEEEIKLLTIEGNLIDRLELLDENSSASLVISTYYNLLPEQAQSDIGVRRTRLERLQPDYNVAYLAADSAEMAEVREKIDEQWTVIQSIHEYFFTRKVVETLNQAYIENFDGLLPEA